MTTVVTGATGHVGANLVRALLQRGALVRVLVHRDITPLHGLDVDMVYGDVCDLGSLLRCFSGADVVFHLAGHIAITSRGDQNTEAVNCMGTANVVRACKDRRVGRLVHFSSIHAVVDVERDSLVNEECLLADGPRDAAYDRSKARGEKIVRDAIDAGLDAIVIAPTAVVGPYDFRPSFVGRILLALAKGRLPVIMSGGFDWVDARDVAAGAIAAAESAVPGRKYLLAGSWRSLPEFANAVARVTGVAAPHVVVPRVLAQACSPLAEGAWLLLKRQPLYTSYSVHALSGHRHVSRERAAAELGYAPRPFEETIRDTCLWFEEYGFLARGTCLEAGR